MDAARPGGGIGSTVTKPNTPNPNVKSLWKYSEVNTSRYAKIQSLNTVSTGNPYNDAVMHLDIEKYKDLSGVVTERLTIFVIAADTACDVSCQLRYKKNGSLSNVYTVRETSEGVLSKNSFASGDMEKLIKAFKISGQASITLPLVGLGDTEFFFDFTGYDNNWMKL